MNSVETLSSGRGRWRAVPALAWMLAVVVAGCASPSGSSEGEVTDAWRASAADHLALYPDANEAQREIFEAAMESGSVSYSDYRERMLAFVGCLEASLPVEVSYNEDYESYGLRIVSVTRATAGDETLEPSIDALYFDCYSREAWLVSDLYLSQPSTVLWFEKHAAGYRSDMIDCLTEAGLAPDPAAPMSELIALDDDQMTGQPDRTPCQISTGLVGSTIVKVG